TFVAVIAVAAGVVLIPGAPLGVVTVGVQALAGILLPSAAVFLLLLCNDPAVLGPWVNPRWLNVIATVVVGLLVALSALVTVNIAFPDADVVAVGVALAGALAVMMGVLAVRQRGGPTRPLEELTPWERSTWTMPRLESLPPPQLSFAREVGLWLLRAYLTL